ncbi:MAG: DUF4625 domain-containing protein [Prevotellaceae bacterium]|jgi:hypothetical protein|nr:DUF4625 domain-containing protein [Prevotellaceae bacterium]
MNTIRFSIICLTAIFSLAFIACKEDDDTDKPDPDTTKPVIELIEPAEDDTLQIGGEHGVHFEAEFSDNEMLASYKVDIHPNFDNHGHATTKSATETVDFEFEHTWTITGKNKAVHHHEIKIPEDATPGHYHLMVYCLDAAGNESHIAVNIELSHEASEEHEHEDEDDV